MIYVTGDTHGILERFKTKEAKALRKGDTLIVCGDFGFLWSGGRAEEKILRWLGKRRYNILFVEGTHDNLSLLAGYPTEEWCGGQVRHISGNLRQLVRGHIFSIEGNIIFAMGGGESSNLDTRVEGETWWPQEMPSPEELAAAKERLAAADNRVDYIVTHQCSDSMHAFLDMDSNSTSPLGVFFDQVERSCSFKKWFFGSYHRDRPLSAKHTVVFQNILPLR